MPEIYKKIFSLKPLSNSCLVKGVLKTYCEDDILECNAILTSGFTANDNYNLVVCDGVKNCVFLFDNFNNLSFKIVDFNNKNLFFIIFKNHDAICYANNSGELTQNQINLAKSLLVSNVETQNFKYDDEALPTYNYYETTNPLYNENFNFNTQNSIE